MQLGNIQYNISESYSLTKAYTQFKDSRAVILRAYRDAQDKRPKLTPANGGWQPDHFMAAAQHGARKTICVAMLAVDVLVRPVLYVTKVTSTTAGCITGAALGATLAMVGGILGATFGSGICDGAAKGANVGFVFGFLATSAPIALPILALCVGFSTVTFAAAHLIGAAGGAVAYACGSTSYLPEASEA